ncbi:MAG: hypothetical protein BWY94_00601 [Actinobacteria bacterium ADurb.BinA094]|nr:MAG: hypothetical protein BWY94_00601 [Actinobacteria bacterium ADurb.BinA094]
MIPVIMSVVCSGRNPNFCTELPRPTPNTRPEAMEISDCVTWYPLPCRSFHGSRKATRRSSRYGSVTIRSSTATTPVAARPIR